MQETVDEMNKMLTSRVAGLTDDVTSLNDSLSTEKSERVNADENLNTKLLAQCEKVGCTCCKACQSMPSLGHSRDRNCPA